MATSTHGVHEVCVVARGVFPSSGEHDRIALGASNVVVMQSTRGDVWLSDLIEGASDQADATGRLNHISGCSVEPHLRDLVVLTVVGVSARTFVGPIQR